MRMSRRRFVGGALGATAAFALPRGVMRASVVAPPACVVFDSGARCLLPESCAGYAAALTTLGVDWERRDRPFDDRPTTIIVPMALVGTAEVAAFLMSRAASGSTVILETAVAFFESVRGWLAERALLETGMGVAIAGPELLWRRRKTGIPYLELTWSVRATVRDFSRLTPMVVPMRAAIATIEGMPAATKRRVGKGTLVVLGSPLGPALGAGDWDARRWLSAVLAQSRESRLMTHEDRRGYSR